MASSAQQLAVVGAGAVGLFLVLRSRTRKRQAAAAGAAIATEPGFAPAWEDAGSTFAPGGYALVDAGFVGDGMGAPRDGGLRKHKGLDVYAPEGTPVRALSWGVVADLSPEGVRQGYGTTVLIQHPSEQLYTMYTHLERWPRELHVGATVAPGDEVGYVGTSGTVSSKPHLHFEVPTGAQLPSYKGRPVVNRDTPRMAPSQYLSQLGATAVP